MRSELEVAFRRLLLASRALPPHDIRMAWSRIKRTFGIPTRADRPFFVNELVRCLELGLIGPDCRIMCTGRTDGAGAQAMAKMSALALARAYGLTYVHTPFRSVEHAEGMLPAEWAAQWERIFNLGHGELSDTDCTLPIVGIEEFIGNRSWWTRPCILNAGHYVRFTDKNPAAYAAIANELRYKYEIHAGPKAWSEEIIVCAHLRRGDVSDSNPQTAHRASSLAHVCNGIAQVRAALAEHGLKARFKVFTQGDATGLEVLTDMGCELRLDTPAIDSYRQLVDADILLMGRSSFSFTAALLGTKGIKIYDAFARAPVPGWLVKDGQGRVDPAELRRRITLMAELRAALRARMGAASEPRAKVNVA